MFSKRSLIVFLVGMNLVLLAVLLSASYSLPTAYAQAARGRPGDWLAVTAKVEGQAFEVLYLLHRQDRKLYAFVPTTDRRRQYTPVGFRDLKTDFGREQD